MIIILIFFEGIKKQIIYYYYSSRLPELRTNVNNVCKVILKINNIFIGHGDSINDLI